ncbi:MAG TPA: septation protein SepH [Jiangellaceae bacterium]
MRQLRLIAVSEDGAHLILAGDDHEQLALQVDERLHAAIRGDRARLGQLEIQLESQLRPREIQARIRAGESVEAVAAVAGMPLEKVRRFAGPVIAEREHIAGRARQATVRRRNGEGKVRTLDAMVGESAAAVGVDPDDIGWDAWRRDDGRWQVRCSWTADDAETAAVFSFDPSGRSVVPEDDTARVVAGEAPPPAPTVIEPADEPEPDFVPGPARLSVVAPPADDIDAADTDALDAPTPVTSVDDPVRPALPTVVDPPIGGLADASAPADDASDAHTLPVPTTSRHPRRGTTRYGRNDRRRRDAEPWREGVDATGRDDEFAGDDTGPDDLRRDVLRDPPQDDPTSDRLRLTDIAAHVEVEESDAPAPSDEAAEPEPASPRKAASGSSRSRRPTVPSWDEIMFGRRKGD